MSTCMSLSYALCHVKYLASQLIYIFVAMDGDNDVFKIISGKIIKLCNVQLFPFLMTNA